MQIPNKMRAKGRKRKVDELKYTKRKGTGGKEYIIYSKA
jgi:hypothetical protein